jgi:putative membrane protein
MLNAIQTEHIFASLVFSLLGIVILVVSFIIIDLLTPSALWKEITERKNLAVAFLAGAFMLSIAIIIASAMH